ncbi:hypothetical protein SBADM41S_08453 [Streptomyces badius]
MTSQRISVSSIRRTARRVPPSPRASARRRAELRAVSGRTHRPDPPAGPGVGVGAGPDEGDRPGPALSALGCMARGINAGVRAGVPGQPFVVDTAAQAATAGAFARPAPGDEP